MFALFIFWLYNLVMLKDSERVNVPVFDPTLMSTNGLSEYYDKVLNTPIESSDIYEQAFYTRLRQVIAEELERRRTKKVDRDMTAPQFEQS